jgi:RNA-directed DNA polymerase
MRTLSLSDISTKQEKMAQQSRQSPSMVLTTLAHHIALQWLYEAYRRTRKDGAAGVDAHKLVVSTAPSASAASG